MIFERFKKIIDPSKDGDKKEQIANVKSVGTKKVATTGVKKVVSGSKVKKGRASAKVYSVIKEPLITEKGGLLQQDNKYLFKVYPGFNKIEIKKAISALYGVHVTAVNIVNLPKKERRRGGKVGYGSASRKAIITVKAGDKIEII